MGQNCLYRGDLLRRTVVHRVRRLTMAKETPIECFYHYHVTQYWRQTWNRCLNEAQRLVYCCTEISDILQKQNISKQNEIGVSSILRHYVVYSCETLSTFRRHKPSKRRQLFTSRNDVTSQELQAHRCENIISLKIRSVSTVHQGRNACNNMFR